MSLPVLMTVFAMHTVAVVVAGLGAVLFGLSAVWQHGAVQESLTTGRQTFGQHVRAYLTLLRKPAWLVGAVQAGVGGLLHVMALALAPIALVQPIGVLAVPVTVVATAVRQRQWPGHAKVLGAGLSVLGIAVLTLLLLAPADEFLTLPPWPVLALTVVGLNAAGVVITAVGPRHHPLIRGVSLAVVAAVLFGLNSILIRLVGYLMTSGSASDHLPTMIIAFAGFAAAVPISLWAMQTAYLSSSSHVVMCCLTLTDPLAAVVGGRVLLDDGGVIGGPTLLGVAGCAAIAAVGVVLLSLDHPTAPAAPEATVNSADVR